jgi:uncharacterized protein (DUF2236 family)
MAAGILQLMLPGLGAGVSDHSNFFDDPYDRIFRSIPFIWGAIFATSDAEGARRGRQIRDFHHGVKGVDHHGRRYHALDPEVFWWAHATFTWEMFRARELYFPIPLSPAAREQLYAETVTWYHRYGVSDRPVPPTYAAFRERFETICRHELELTPAVQWVLDPTENPASQTEPIRLPSLLAPLSGLVTRLGSDLLRTMVFGAMPDVVRRRFGFRWTHADRLAFVGVCAALKAATPAVDRGALELLWPEGTPHLDPRDRTRVVLAGPNPRQRRGAYRRAKRVVA